MLLCFLCASICWPEAHQLHTSLVLTRSSSGDDVFRMLRHFLCAAYHNLLNPFPRTALPNGIVSCQKFGLSVRQILTCVLSIATKQTHRVVAPPSFTRQKQAIKPTDVLPLHVAWVSAVLSSSIKKRNPFARGANLLLPAGTSTNLHLPENLITDNCVQDAPDLKHIFLCQA